MYIYMYIYILPNDKAMIKFFFIRDYLLIRLE